MVQTVNRRLFTVEDGGTCFSPNSSIFHQCSTLVFIYAHPCQKYKREKPGKLSKAMLFRKSGASSNSSSDAIYSYEGLKTADQSRAIIFP